MHVFYDKIAVARNKIWWKKSLSNHSLSCDFQIPFCSNFPIILNEDNLCVVRPLEEAENGNEVAQHFKINSLTKL